MTWKPATLDEVKCILARSLLECDEGQHAAFQRFRVEPIVAPLERYGKIEHVFVVARRGNEAMYWEDVEEGFNISQVNSDGSLLNHYCNQDTLGLALNRWMAS